MKKMTYILAAAMLLLLPSCRFIKVDKEMLKDLDEKVDVFQGGGEKITASDNYITRRDTTGEFHAISCNLPAEVIYVPGNCGITIYGPDNIVEKVIVKNNNGRLEVKSGAQRIRNLKKGFTITVSSPVLENVTLNGAVTFKADEGITALDFEGTINGAGDFIVKGLKSDRAYVTVNGAGDAKLEGLDCESVKFEINGAGDCVLSGRSESASLTISGAGDIDATKLVCPDVKTSVRGLGSIKKPNA